MPVLQEPGPLLRLGIGPELRIGPEQLRPDPAFQGVWSGLGERALVRGLARHVQVELVVQDVLHAGYERVRPDDAEDGREPRGQDVGREEAEDEGRAEDDSHRELRHGLLGALADQRAVAGEGGLYEVIYISVKKGEMIWFFKRFL